MLHTIFSHVQVPCSISDSWQILPSFSRGCDFLGPLGPWVSGIRDVGIGDAHSATTGAVNGTGRAPRRSIASTRWFFTMHQGQKKVSLMEDGLTMEIYGLTMAIHGLTMAIYDES